MKPVLSLKDFIHRAKVKAQYRDFFREVRHLDKSVQVELKNHIRKEFKKNLEETNKETIKSLLIEATQQLQILQSYVRTSSKKLNMDPSMISGTMSTESWVGSGEEYDIRGRMGTEWPWSK
jgi:t-SNARE complex subunit (syntaxin)